MYVCPLKTCKTCFIVRDDGNLIMALFNPVKIVSDTTNLLLIQKH